MKDILLTDDAFTLDIRLCDDAGMVSDARTEPGTEEYGGVAPGLTYLARLNALRAMGGEEPYVGAPFGCTGHAHLAGHHIRCTSPAHGGVAAVVLTDIRDVEIGQLRVRIAALEADLAARLIEVERLRARLGENE